MKRYLLLFLTLFLVSCSEEKKSESGLKKITLQLNWFPEAEHGGYYEAALKGYYEDVGLDVEIIPGGPGVRVESETALGRVDFGIANADKILTVRDKGMNLVPLMSPFQISPRCLMAHSDSGIKSFEDLIKAEVLILNNTKPFYKWLLYKYPVIEKTDTIPYNKASFMTDKSSIMQGYVNSEPLIMKEKGIDVNILSVSKTGFNPYTSVLITDEKLLDSNPELVKKVKEASIKGWISYLENPAKTNAHIEEINPANKGTLNASTEAMRELMSSQGNFGEMKLERWQELAEQLKVLGILDKVPADIESILP